MATLTSMLVSSSAASRRETGATSSRRVGKKLGASSSTGQTGFTTGVRQRGHSFAPGFSSTPQFTQYDIHCTPCRLLSMRTCRPSRTRKRKNSRSRSVSFCTPEKVISIVSP